VAVPSLEYIGKLLLKVLPWLIPSRWKRPAVTFGPTTRTQDVAWWHTEVFLRQRALSQTEEINNCRAEVRVGSLQVSAGTLRLMWSTVQGPQPQMALRLGEDPAKLPIIVRSEKTCQLSADAIRLPHFPLPAYTARFTDDNAIIHRTSFTDLPPGEHTITVRILSGRHVLAEKVYVINVPRVGEPNADFTVREAG